VIALKRLGRRLDGQGCRTQARYASKRAGPCPEQALELGGRYWDRTSDLPRMAPRGLEDQQPPGKFELTAGHYRLPDVAISGRWLLVDVVVAHRKPCQQRFTVGVGADGEQGPAVRARETPCQRVDLADPVDAQTLRPGCLAAVCPGCQRGDQMPADRVGEQPAVFSG